MYVMNIRKTSLPALHAHINLDSNLCRLGMKTFLLNEAIFASPRRKHKIKVYVILNIFSYSLSKLIYKEKSLNLIPFEMDKILNLI